MNANVSIVDTFSRNVSDSWGSTDTGQAWLNETSSSDVNGYLASTYVGTSTTYRTHYIDLDAAGYSKQAASSSLAILSWNADSLTPATDMGLTLNVVSTNTFYFCSLKDSLDQIEIGVYIGGTRYQMNQTGMSLQANVKYWVRFEVTTSGVYLKVWRVGTPEPGWSLTSGLWTGSNPPGAGHAGTFHKGTTTMYYANYHAFYYYTGDDSEGGYPQLDGFDRTVSEGFGVNSNGTLWQGNVAYDPDLYTLTAQGTVSDPGDGRAALTTQGTTSIYGLYGPRRTTDAEVLTEYAINSSLGTTFFYVGLRGRLNPVDGVASPTGYGLYIQTGATSIAIRKCTNGVWGASLATSGAITALAANTTYSIRFQATGGSPSTTLRARIWQTGTAEPGTWNVTYTDNSPITSSGSSWFELSQNVSTARILTLYRWDYQAPTATTTTIQTTTTNVTSSSITDTVLNLQANFTGDTTGLNNTISVRYRPTSSSIWQTNNITMGTRAATNWPFSITGLQSAMQYVVEVTYNDADGVAGTNPITTTFTTTNTRVSPGTAYISAISQDTISIVAPYSGDTDNDSTAVVNSRLSSQQTYPLVEVFDSAINLNLEDHLPQVGSAWVKRGTPTFVVNNKRVSVDLSTSVIGYYTNNTSITNSTFIYTANFRFDNPLVSLGLITHFNTATSHHYRWYYSASDSKWYVVRSDSGGTPVLATSAEYPLDRDALHYVRVEVNADSKVLFVNNQEVLRTTDATLASGGVGLWAGATELISGSPYNTGSFGDLRVSSRTTGAGWSANTSLTPDRVNKKFDISVGSLSADAVYEFRITYADPDGINGANTIQYLSGMTTGQSATLASMTFTPQYTTSVVFVNYAYDSNSDSELGIQYRSTMESMWTTVPATSISVNRGSKQFSAVLSGLRPGMSYVVRATLTDPNGIIEGGVAELTAQFSTLSTSTRDITNSKEYLWKVYNREDKYVGTWYDAGVPDFSWHLDSGLGECRTELHRPYSSLTDTTPTLDTMYRVDIIATAPGSSGLTPNMLVDRNFAGGMWVIGANAEAQSTSGPNGAHALRLLATATTVVTLSENIVITPSTPVTASVLAQSKGTGRLKVQFRAYDAAENVIETSNTFGMTVGSQWQKLVVDYLPPRTTSYVRLMISNDGAGTMYAANPFVSQREMLVYRGYVQSYEAQIDDRGERIEVDLYSQSTVLSDDYVEWLQFVTPQPAQDAVDGKPNRGEADPSDMLKALVDLAQQQNPRFNLYYTDTSIKQTGKQTDFTFEDMSFEEAFEAVISLAPLNWHINIAPDGLVSFFSPSHVVTHNLRLGVEISEFTRSPNVSDVKNYIVVYGTQEEDKKVKHVEFDQNSIKIHGRRVEIFNESGIESDRAAEIWAEGKLAELSQPTVAMEATIPDTNSIQLSPNQTMRGYTIEQFKPGDLITVTDPVALPEDTLWDQFLWDVDSWDSNPVVREIVPTPVPIKTIEYDGDSCTIELADHPPSVSKEHARLWRYIQKQERKQRLGLN